MGIIVAITLNELAKKYNNNKKKLIKALALTHLITNYVSLYSGHLSIFCGVNIKAGVGLAAGIAYYLLDNHIEINNKVNIIGSAINNTISEITGIICDGAKKGCAFKSATAVDASITAALLAVNGIETTNNEGIINTNPLLSIKNIKIISDVMKTSNSTIIKEILEKNTIFEKP